MARDQFEMMDTTTQSEAPRAWQRMLSGRRLDLLDPKPSEVEIQDIAHGLARVARWNGQTQGPCALSVAQHVVMVEEIASSLNPEWPGKWRLAALLHDAPEYVIGDLISPFKTAIGLDYKAFEIRLLSAIHERFGLPRELPHSVVTEIKRADRISAYYEATRLAGFSEEEGMRYFGHDRAINPSVAKRLESLQPAPAGEAQQQFLARFDELFPVG